MLVPPYGYGRFIFRHHLDIIPLEPRNTVEEEEKENDTPEDPTEETEEEIEEEGTEEEVEEETEEEVEEETEGDTGNVENDEEPARKKLETGYRIFFRETCVSVIGVKESQITYANLNSHLPLEWFQFKFPLK